MVNLFFNVTPTEIKVDGDSIDVAMVINEGQQATIQRCGVLWEIPKPTSK
jgi:hypothetical protein